MIKTEFSVTLNSKDWSQCGEDVLLTVSVVCVCDPSTVNTAKGSGDLKISRLYKPSAARTLTVIFERGAGILVEEVVYGKTQRQGKKDAEDDASDRSVPITGLAAICPFV